MSAEDDSPTRRAVRSIPNREHAQRSTGRTDWEAQRDIRRDSDKDEAPARRWEPKR